MFLETLNHKVFYKAVIVKKLKYQILKNTFNLKTINIPILCFGFTQDRLDTTAELALNADIRVLRVKMHTRSIFRGRTQNSILSI